MEIERKYEQKIELNSGTWGKGVCDVWEKGAGEREKKMKRKSNYILAYGEKGVCDVWEKGVGEREKDEKKNELNSGIWGKGVCDVWEKGVGEREKKCQIEFLALLEEARGRAVQRLGRPLLGARGDLAKSPRGGGRGGG